MTMANVPEAARAMQLAIEDEAKFIDFKRSAMWLGKEHVFIDRRYRATMTTPVRTGHAGS
jgi:hypothetical protein